MVHRARLQNGGAALAVDDGRLLGAAHGGGFGGQYWGLGAARFLGRLRLGGFRDAGLRVG